MLVWSSSSKNEPYLKPPNIRYLPRFKGLYKEIMNPVLKGVSTVIRDGPMIFEAVNHLMLLRDVGLGAEPREEGACVRLIDESCATFSTLHRPRIIY